jgi:hypothetical protein
MGKYSKYSIQAAAFTAALFGASSLLASPPTDDVTKAEGCISLTGGSGGFTLSASFDVGTHAVAGNFQYVDTAAKFKVSSNTLLDYSYIDTNVRGFIFTVTGSANYNSARIFVQDNGSTGDRFEIQLLQNGNIVYDAWGDLSSDCAGNGVNGVVIGGSYCPCEDENTPKPPKDNPPPNHIKGNNGVGNGIDPQPPGNPPINDGPGTSPGNPGNRGGPKKR